MTGARRPGTSPLSGELTFTRLEKVLFGPGRIVSLGEVLRSRGVERALV